MSDEETIKLIDDCLGRLREHFEHVQVLASREDIAGETTSIFRGSGNWYARRGMAQDFVERDQASTNAQRISEALKPKDDGE